MMRSSSLGTKGGWKQVIVALEIMSLFEGV
jgi:hypothetical protein